MAHLFRRYKTMRAASSACLPSGKGRRPGSSISKKWLLFTLCPTAAWIVGRIPVFSIDAAARPLSATLQEASQSERYCKGIQRLQHAKHAASQKSGLKQMIESGLNFLSCYAIAKYAFQMIVANRFADEEHIEWPRVRVPYLVRDPTDVCVPV